jgi:hypothetical protein
MNGGIYGVLDEAIAFGKKLQKDEHDRLMSKKEDVVLEDLNQQVFRYHSPKIIKNEF